MTTFQVTKIVAPYSKTPSTKVLGTVQAALREWPESSHSTISVRAGTLGWSSQSRSRDRQAKDCR